VFIAGQLELCSCNVEILHPEKTFAR